MSRYINFMLLLSPSYVSSLYSLDHIWYLFWYTRIFVASFIGCRDIFYIKIILILRGSFYVEDYFKNLKDNQFIYDYVKLYIGYCCIRIPVWEGFFLTFSLLEIIFGNSLLENLFSKHSFQNLLFENSIFKTYFSKLTSQNSLFNFTFWN